MWNSIKPLRGEDIRPLQSTHLTYLLGVKRRVTFGYLYMFN